VSSSPKAKLTNIFHDDLVSIDDSFMSEILISTLKYVSGPELRAMCWAGNFKPCASESCCITDYICVTLRLYILNANAKLTNIFHDDLVSIDDSFFSEILISTLKYVSGPELRAMCCAGNFKPCALESCCITDYICVTLRLYILNANAFVQFS
jgi:hypothetical protein